MFTFLTFRINYFCSSLNCSSAVQLGYTLSQKNLDFSVQNFQKCLFFVVLSMARMGVAKTDQTIVKCKTRYSRFIYTPTRKNIFIKNKLSYSQSQIPNKIKQNPKSSSPSPLSYPISSKPTKIKHFIHFTTQKSNFNLTKIYPQIQNLPYLYALLPITFFHLKIAQIISHHTPYTGGAQKLHAKLSRQ